MQECPGLSHTKPAKERASDQPGKRENWEVQHPMSYGLTPGRTAREKQSQEKGSKGLAEGHSAVSGRGWTECLPQAKTLALESYSFQQSQQPQVQSFFLVEEIVDYRAIP